MVLAVPQVIEHFLAFCSIRGEEGLDTMKYFTDFGGGRESLPIAARW